MSEIRGIGIDLCGIARMVPMLEKQSFLDRVCTAQEQAYLRGRGQAAADSLAAIWAAKEAACKAFGTGVTFSMKDVEIVHLPSGQPCYQLHDKAAALAEGGHLLLSLTHENDTAAAVCIWLTE